MTTWCVGRCLAVGILAAVLGLAGCSAKEDKKGDDKAAGDGKKADEKPTKFNKESYAKVNFKMTEKEVIDVIGPPTETKDVEQGGQKLKEATWKAGNGSATMTFDKDGKMTAMSGGFVDIDVKIK